MVFYCYSTPDLHSCYQVLKMDMFRMIYDAWEENVQEDTGCTIMYTQ